MTRKNRLIGFIIYITLKKMKIAPEYAKVPSPYNNKASDYITRVPCPSRNGNPST